MSSSYLIWNHGEDFAEFDAAQETRCFKVKSDRNQPPTLPIPNPVLVFCDKESINFAIIEVISTIPVPNWYAPES